MERTIHRTPDAGAHLQERVRQATLELLLVTARPMSVSELRARLRARGVRAPDYGIARALRVLRSGGEVQLDRGKWSATPRPALLPARGDPTGPRGRVADQGPQPSSWSPSTSWLLTGAPSTVGEDRNRQAAPEEPESVHEETGPWAMFRKLLGYYADCVRNDQGSEASGNLSDLGRRFIALRGIGSWYPRTGHAWSMLQAATPEVGAVIRHLEGSGDGGVLVVGYPLWIFSPTSSENGLDEPFLKPIFTCAVDYKLSAEGLRISCDDASLDVNLDWLSYALRKPDLQRAFLAMAGLMDRRGPEDEVGDGSGVLLSRDLRSLATAVTTFFGAQVREPLCPEAPTPMRASSRPQSGIYNHAILMAANRTRYAQSLLRDLARIRRCPDDALDRTALRPIFHSTGAAGVPAPATEVDATQQAELSSTRDVIDTCDVNAEQRHAIACILSEQVTVVTGPPGTGKSQVVAAAIANGRLIGHTVLFASRNHKAIDAVVGRPEMFTANDLPLIVRANDKDGAQSFTFADAIKEILSAPNDSSAAERSSKIRGRIENRLVERRKLIAQSEEREHVRDELTQLEIEICEAVDGWSEAEVEALDSNLDGFPMHLVRQLQCSLAGIPGEPADSWWRRVFLWLRTRHARRLARAVRQALAPKLGIWAAGLDRTDLQGLPTITARLPKLLHALRYIEARLRQRPLEARAAELPSSEVLAPRILEATTDLRHLSPAALEADAQARSGLPRDTDRSRYASLQVGLRRHANALVAAETDQEAREALDSHLPDLLWHYPAWAVTNLSIGSRMPLTPAMFDVAIIDEASQCDIASAIPVLFRAKRAAVVGDPLQLAHSTKLTRSRDNVLCRRNGVTSLREQRFSFPDTSLFDLFAQTTGVHPVLLRDHYRCAPDIAGYANRAFYGSRLRILTAASRLRVPRDLSPGIHWTVVQSAIEPRKTGCVAPDEIATCRSLLRRLLLEQSFEGTVGIVTPFREQKQALQDAIAADPEVFDAGRRANLVIDTAHGFQGDERDVMLMSLCAGPSMPPTSLAWLRKTGNLLNVAATRARAVLHVVGNRAWAEACGIPHVAALARPQSPETCSADTAEARFESPWEKRLYQALEARGLRPVPQYPLLGRRLDLALVAPPSAPIDIEVDGARFHREPDGSRRRDDIWRDITIQGAGWKVLRFWVYELRQDMDACVARVMREWGAP